MRGKNTKGTLSQPCHTSTDFSGGKDWFSGVVPNNNKRLFSSERAHVLENRAPYALLPQRTNPEERQEDRMNQVFRSLCTITRPAHVSREYTGTSEMSNFTCKLIIFLLSMS